jgi:tetratricopeptide (TPR) repeat protein
VSTLCDRRIRAARRALSLVTLATSLGIAAPALADSALDEAKALTSKATVEYNVGKFQEALDLYSKAYERFPTPVLLFDIGQCHKLLKNYERALFFFRGYLHAQPTAANRAAVEALIDEAQREFDSQRALEAAKAGMADDSTPTQPAPSPAHVEKPAPAPAAPPAPVDAPQPNPGSAPLRIAGLTTAGAGVVAIGLGAYFGLHSTSLSNEISGVSSARGTWSAQDQSDYDAGKTGAMIANVLYVAGGVALATGALHTFLGWPRGSTTVHATATFTPDPGGGQIVVVGRF